MKDRVRGKRPGDPISEKLRLLAHRSDHFQLLGPEEPPFSSMRVEPRHHDNRIHRAELPKIGGARGRAFRSPGLSIQQVQDRRYFFLGISLSGMPSALATPLP